MDDQQRSYQDNKFYTIPTESQFSITTAGMIKNNKTAKILNPFIDKDGYHRVTLCRKGQAKKYYVHRLVAITFIPEGYKEHLQVNHKNSIRDDNHYRNLEWVTPQENTAHGITFGSIVVKGENCPRSKLTELDVINICKAINNKEALTSISKRMNIPLGTIFSIKSGQTWREISTGILKTFVKPKISKDTVIGVCELLQHGKSIKDILEVFPEINRNHIGNIKRRKTFTDISDKYSW